MIIEANWTSNGLPWVEKYRPRNLEDVLSNEHVASTLKAYLSKGSLPNLLFYGSPGTGKTSTILAASKTLYGSSYRYMVLELNASDERGINVVRHTIKQFAESQPPMANQSIEFKLVILDEADAMTRDAQAALRRVIEKYSKTTRFCLICNHVSHIIPALQSRCTRFKFKSIPKESAIARLHAVCREENLNLSENVINELVTHSEGDMRRAINILQGLYLRQQRPDGKSIVSEITVDDFYSIVGAVSPLLVDRVLKVLLEETFTNALNFILSEMKNSDCSIKPLIPKLSERLACLDAGSTRVKAQLLISLADLESKESIGLKQNQLISYLVACFVDARSIN